jgi:hypothetical protein
MSLFNGLVMTLISYGTALHQIGGSCLSLPKKLNGKKSVDEQTETRPIGVLMLNLKLIIGILVVLNGLFGILAHLVEKGRRIGHLCTFLGSIQQHVIIPRNPRISPKAAAASASPS